MSSKSVDCNRQEFNLEEGVRKQSDGTGGTGIEENRATDFLDHSDSEQSASTCSDVCSLITPPYSPIISSNDDDDDNDDYDDNFLDLPIFNGILANVPALSCRSR